MRTYLEQIPEGNYTGYYWLSNAEFPEVVSGNFPENLLEKTLPFVVEANLFDANNNQSISIRHNGERHVIQAYNLSDLTDFEKNEVAFIAHRLQEKGKAKFWELWREEADDLCAGMKTLRPYGRAFVGFETN